MFPSFTIHKHIHSNGVYLVHFDVPSLSCASKNNEQPSNVCGLASNNARATETAVVEMEQNPPLCRGSTRAFLYVHFNLKRQGEDLALL